MNLHNYICTCTVASYIVQYVGSLVKTIALLEFSWSVWRYSVTMYTRIMDFSRFF